jgi:glycosyltransferase involved in cell wall biosynthesis
MAPQANYFHCDEVMRAAFHESIWQQTEERKSYFLVSTFRDNLYKGLETAMEAFQLLEPQLDRPLEWHIIGIPDDSHYYRVCVRKTRLPEKSGLQVLGNKSATEMIFELENADVFVHPSHIDNSPNSLCEAMLMGIPIVATNVGGIPNILANGSEGLLVQNGDAYALAGAILQLLRNRSWAKSLADNARKKALKRNDRNKIINDLLSIYKKINKEQYQVD